MAALFPYRADGADYRCNLCDAVIPEGAHVHADIDNDVLVWVKAVSVDGEVLHECGEVLGG
jgi:hypothetical protein